MKQSQMAYVFSRNSIVLGSNVARDLGGAEVGDSVKSLLLIDGVKIKLEDLLYQELLNLLVDKDLIIMQ